jgi:hypothetical protein
MDTEFYTETGKSKNVKVPDSGHTVYRSGAAGKMGTRKCEILDTSPSNKQTNKLHGLSPPANYND